MTQTPRRDKSGEAGLGTVIVWIIILAFGLWLMWVLSHATWGTMPGGV